MAAIVSGLWNQIPYQRLNRSLFMPTEAAQQKASVKTTVSTPVRLLTCRKTMAFRAYNQVQGVTSQSTLSAWL
jgi:hypothetical protein